MTQDDSRQTIQPTSVFLFFSGLFIAIGASIYAYVTAQQREDECLVSGLADAMIGRAARDCETGVPVGAWIAIGAGILMLIAGIVVFAMPTSTSEASSIAADVQVPQETVEDRLTTLKRLLDQELITEEEYSRRREAILDDLQGM